MTRVLSLCISPNAVLVSFLNCTIAHSVLTGSVLTLNSSLEHQAMVNAEEHHTVMYKIELVFMTWP